MALLAKIVVTKRAHNRRPVRLDGTLRLENEPFDVTIDDLSVCGFGASTNADLRPGDRIRIAAPALRARDAEVVWVRNGKVGFEFLSPISTADVASAEPIETVAHLEPKSLPDPVIEKWPQALRVGIIVGSSIVLWVIIVALTRLL
jgi:hypothetical protein